MEHNQYLVDWFITAVLIYTVVRKFFDDDNERSYYKVYMVAYPLLTALNAYHLILYIDTLKKMPVLNMPAVSKIDLWLPVFWRELWLPGRVYIMLMLMLIVCILAPIASVIAIKRRNGQPQ